MLSPEITEAWSWFQKIAPDSYFEELIAAHHLRSRKRIYWLAEVVWLMIYQRLARDGSLASAVCALAQGSVLRLQGSGGRAGRKKKISGSTGGYCQARQRLPTLVAAQVSDRIFEQLRAQAQQGDPKLKRPIFVIDGSTLRLSHEPDVVEAFPPGHNQHGENHWPVLSIVAFHDAHTGLAARPSWGPMYGPQAVSEQYLAEQALARLPAGQRCLPMALLASLPLPTRCTVVTASAAAIDRRPCAENPRRHAERNASQGDLESQPVGPAKTL